MILRFLFYGLLIYLGFRFVFNFLIPLFQTTKQVKRQFDEVRNRMQDQMNNPYAPGATAGKQPEPTPKAAKEDYIDFEELKD